MLLADAPMPDDFSDAIPPQHPRRQAGDARPSGTVYTEEWVEQAPRQADRADPVVAHYPPARQSTAHSSRTLRHKVLRVRRFPGDTYPDH